ncbi:DUF3800 domain-containing protein [Fervidibacter sacchari]
MKSAWQSTNLSPNWSKTASPKQGACEIVPIKDSRQSYFIQLVDFCAYALLRRERPIPSKTKYGLDKAFNLLSPILVREANKDDPDGIIRP